MEPDVDQGVQDHPVGNNKSSVNLKIRGDTDCPQSALHPETLSMAVDHPCERKA